MNRFAYLVEDPRPDLEMDSHLWVSLLRSAVAVPDLDKSYILSHRLWSLRYAGTFIRRTHMGTRFEPLLEKNGPGLWDSVEEFEQIKRDHLMEFRKDIEYLLRILS